MSEQKSIKMFVQLSKNTFRKKIHQGTSYKIYDVEENVKYDGGFDKYVRDAIVATINQHPELVSLYTKRGRIHQKTARYLKSSTYESLNNKGYPLLKQIEVVVKGSKIMRMMADMDILTTKDVALLNKSDSPVCYSFRGSIENAIIYVKVFFSPIRMKVVIHETDR